MRAHPIISSCSTKPDKKKASPLMKILENFLEKRSGDWIISREGGKSDRATGLGRKTREQIGKENQVTSLRFQTRSANQMRALKFQTAGSSIK